MKFGDQTNIGNYDRAQFIDRLFTIPTDNVHNIFLYQQKYIHFSPAANKLIGLRCRHRSVQLYVHRSDLQVDPLVRCYKTRHRVHIGQK